MYKHRQVSSPLQPNPLDRSGGYHVGCRVFHEPETDGGSKALLAGQGEESIDEETVGHRGIFFGDIAWARLSMIDR